MNVQEKELIGKNVVNEVGMVIGKVRDSEIDETTQEMTSLLVEPSENIDPRLYKLDPEGNIVYPSRSIRSVVKNAVIVEDIL